MSYILDALKKLEKERKRGEVPDPLTVQHITIQEPKKRRLWPYLLLVSLVLNAGLLVWWVVPWQSIKPDTVTDQQLETKVATSSSSPTLPKPPVETRDIAKQSKPVQRKTVLQKKTPPISSPKTGTKKAHEVSPPVLKQTAVQSPLPSESKPVSDRMSRAKNKVYNLDELPLSIREGLPNLTVSISLYSDDPASRMAKINGQMLREGQYLTADLRLDEITPEDIIFSYQKYRFRIKLR